MLNLQYWSKFLAYEQSLTGVIEKYRDFGPQDFFQIKCQGAIISIILGKILE